MSDARDITIGSAGRVVIPKSVRDRLGLKPGTPLKISVHDGRVELEPKLLEARVVRKGRVAVIEPLEPVEPMTEAGFQHVLDDLRERRVD